MLGRAEGASVVEIGQRLGWLPHTMRAAFDKILANGLKRQHSIRQIISDLLQAEIAEKQGSVRLIV